MKINPNDPATGFGYANQHSRQEYIGLRKREYFAAMCLQGILANKGYTIAPEFIANQSVAYADALIEQLNKTTS